jgi:Uma2 family endonuclease
MWQEFVSPFLVVELLSPGREADDLRFKGARVSVNRRRNGEVYETDFAGPKTVFDHMTINC